MNALPEGQGLYAFRVAYQQVTRRTPQQMEAELKFLSKPETAKNVADVSHWMVSWENRMAMLNSMDARYTITEQSRRNIAYECMPTELQTILDTEHRRGLVATTTPSWKSMAVAILLMPPTACGGIST